MEQGENSLAAALTGHERRAVGERRPAPRGQRRLRLGQHLARHRDVLRDLEVGERTIAGERGEFLWLFPSEAAAEVAVALPELHRHEVVILARGKARTG